MHALDPDTAVEPTGHAAQTLEPLTEKVLRAQSAEMPLTQLLPAAHETQPTAWTAYVVFWHGVQLEALAIEKEPARQGEHADAPASEK